MIAEWPQPVEAPINRQKHCDKGLAAASCSMYKIPLLLSLSFAVSIAMTQDAHAGVYKCKGDSVEQGGSTKYKVKRSGTTITIEKGGSTKGKAVLRGSKYSVEVGGSTKATIENGKIYKGGSTWASESVRK